MQKNLKQKLEYHYSAFDRSKLSPDPLEFPHRFTNPLEIELVAFIASVFAYGNVRQIGTALEQILRIMKQTPLKYLQNSSPSGIKKDFHSLTHRFYTPQDSARLFQLLAELYSKGQTLKYLFESFYNGGEIKSAISSFQKYFLAHSTNHSKPTSGFRFMFPLPEKGSACKRINLFLRWMVRKDELDFGFWDFISPSKLIIPVDTHIARIAISLKLTTRKNVSWQMAEEITSNLGKFDPVDPVKYDFALCHIGIRKLSFD